MLSAVPQPRASSQRNLDDRNFLHKKVKDVLEEMCGIDSEISDFVSHYSTGRVITDVKEILKLFEKNCKQQGCSGHCFVVNFKSDGGVLIITWKRSKGHVGCGNHPEYLMSKEAKKSMQQHFHWQHR